MSSFALYYNTWNPHVNVHRTECHVFEGRKSDENSAGGWEHPFSTRQAAEERAGVISREKSLPGPAFCRRCF